MKNIEILGTRIAFSIVSVALIIFNISIKSNYSRDNILNLFNLEQVALAGSECSTTCTDGTTKSIDNCNGECRAKTNYGVWCVEDGIRTDEDLC